MGHLHRHRLCQLAKARDAGEAAPERYARAGAEVAAEPNRKPAKARTKAKAKRKAKGRRRGA